MKKGQIHHPRKIQPDNVALRKTADKEKRNCLQNPAWRVFAISELGCEAYWLYGVACNNPAWQGYWGYGFIGGGFIVGAVKELGLRNRKPNAYQITNIITGQTVTASLIVGYLQDFVSETSIPWAITANAGVIIFAGAGSLWHLKLNRMLANRISGDSKIFRAASHVINFLYDGLLGASIAYYGQGLSDNFNYTISPQWTYGTQVAAGLVYAAFNTLTVDQDIFQNPSRARLGMLIYAIFNLAFNTISYSFDFAYISFQILMDSFAAYEASEGKEDYVSDSQFYISLAISFSILVLSSCHYGYKCKQDIEHPEEISDDEEAGETTKLIQEVASYPSEKPNYDNDEDKIVEVLISNNAKESKDNCCTPFWKKITACIPATDTYQNRITYKRQ